MLFRSEFGTVNVDVEHFRHYFPEATFTLISDRKHDIKGFDKKFYVYPTFKKEEDPRYGWHMNDLWQIAWMFRSEADICIAFDADVRIVSDQIRTIIPLVKRFGLCLPANGRMIVHRDATFGMDGGEVGDDSKGNGFALNTAITALDMKNRMALNCANTFCELMQENPQRAPLIWWKAIWKTGFFPCLLPFQWCVCNDHIGCGDEILLHVGHTTVKEHYKELISQAV